MSEKLEGAIKTTPGRTARLFVIYYVRVSWTSIEFACKGVELGFRVESNLRLEINSAGETNSRIGRMGVG